jgi:hypothetical protein
MSASDRNSIAGTTVFHPLGAIRLTSPAEEQVARRSTTASPNGVQRAINVLRNFARVYVESQQHRNGF